MSEDEGDWFERALREDETDDESPTTEAEDGEEPPAAEGGDEPPATEGGDEPPATEGGDEPPATEGGEDARAGSPETAVERSWATEAGGESRKPDPDSAGSGGGFGEDFASAFDEADGDAGEEFDQEYTSDIPRIDLGIPGLDQMIQGGIPARHLLTCIGGPGSGKTTFGLQFLEHGVRNGQRGVMLALEQSHDAILDTASEHGWPFDEYEEGGDLAVVDLDPVEMANSLDNIRSELPSLIEEFGAERLVLDSVSLLEMMYDDQARRRTEVFDFTRSLKQAGVTTLLTSEADLENPYTSRHGIIEYLTDAVFVLQYVRGESTETRLSVEIQKIRNANHSREAKPYDIASGGISVYQQATIF